MLKIKRTIIFGLLLLVAVALNAQQTKVTAAYTFLQQGKLDSAKICIDAAVVHPETQADGQAWYVRGFIYKEIYKSYSKSSSSYNVTYSAENGGTAQNSNVTVGWSYSFIAKKGTFVSLSAQVQRGTAVTAVIYVNDQIFKTLKSIIRQFCSKKCRYTYLVDNKDSMLVKQSKTNLERYGVQYYNTKNLKINYKNPI